MTKARQLNRMQVESCESDRNEDGFNDFDAENHVITDREHCRQTCNCWTPFSAAYGTHSTGQLKRSQSKINILEL